MAIKGSLSEASLPDVLQLLAMGQKTGCLSVTDRANFGYIYFDRGRITYASSSTGATGWATCWSRTGWSRR
jgi:hypothetical protein